MTLKVLVNHIWDAHKSDPNEAHRMGMLLLWVCAIPRKR